MDMTNFGLGFEVRTALLVVFLELRDEVFVLGSALDRMGGDGRRRHVD